MDAIRDLYQKFFMRDVLSFVTPGAVVSATFWYCWDWPLNIPHELMKSWGFPFIFFGFFYVIGFVCQTVALLFTCMSYYEDATDFYTRQYGVLTVDGQNRDEVLQQHERFIVLKQLCSNNCVAFIISGVSLVCSFSLSQMRLTFLGLSCIIVGVVLCFRFEFQKKEQDVWEEIVINCARLKRGVKAVQQS